jgi:2-polyprenyl-3-methyl-5-hydroxy-6-metoxy-1,4-benzoquinol methylase
MILFGHCPHHRVLVIGSGVGTVTQLIADTLDSRGSVTGIDLSPKSIEVAQRRFSDRPNVRLIAGDILEVDLDDRFDVVVLPDVLEHIPLEVHPQLFRRVANWMKDDGFAFLHYPNPHHLQWVCEHRPQLLQVVDQPIHADVLLSNTYPHGLYLDHYERYSIWVQEGDYVFAVLRSASGVNDFHDLPEPVPRLWLRIGRRIKRDVRALAQRRERDARIE